MKLHTDASFSESFGGPLADVGLRILAPLWVVFAIYVLIHGHDSPGGGFQAGVILAVTSILPMLIEGRCLSTKRREAFTQVAFLGVFFYAWIGCFAALMGAPFLDYSQLPIDLNVDARRAMGSLGIEIGVALTVWASMTLIADALLPKRAKGLGS